MSRNKRRNKTAKKVASDTKKKLRYLFILDRSSSMGPVRIQTKNNVNEQIAVIRQGAKDNNIDATITLQLFDSNYDGDAGFGQRGCFEYVFTNENVTTIRDITDSDYSPRGGTPLQDAIGNGITKLQEVLGNELGEKDLNVLVTIFTDGEENSSKQYSREDIEKMIKHLSEDGKYVFTFIGAGGIAQVQEVARGLGIKSSNSVAYSNDIKGHTLVGKSLRSSTARYLTGYAANEDMTCNFFSAPSAEDDSEDLVTADKTDKKKVDKV